MSRERTILCNTRVIVPCDKSTVFKNMNSELTKYSTIDDVD